MPNVILENISPDAYLQKIAAVLLDCGADPAKLETAVTVMHTLFASLSGIRGAMQDTAERYETSLAGGFALSPGYAADCLLDTKRTVKYLRAVDLAVKQLLQEQPGRTVHILYAGCGPFAPLVLPLTTCYTPGQIRITALDIHERALAALEKIVQAVDKQEYFRKLTACDATSYSHTGAPFHILVTETMHQALSREPHVMICRNLAPQLTEGGIMIPERVALTACLSVEQEEMQYLANRLSGEEITAVRLNLGPVFEITKEKSYQVLEDGHALQGARLRIPDHTGSRNLLVLLTEITLFGTLCLKERESGITCPCYARDLEKWQPGDIIDFTFRIKENPRLEYKLCRELVL